MHDDALGVNRDIHLSDLEVPPSAFRGAAQQYTDIISNFGALMLGTGPLDLQSPAAANLGAFQEDFGGGPEAPKMLEQLKCQSKCSP
jgi:hypothetical protein